MAKALNGIVQVGAVDMTIHQAVGSQYGIQGFPTIKIFGANKKSPVDYQGQRTAEAMVEAAMKEASNTAKARVSGKASSSGSSSSSSSSSGSSGGASRVITLTDANFRSQVLESDELWIVEFFAPWCGHCKNLAPHWESAARELFNGKVPIKLGALDATAHQQMASKYEVRGYPTIKIFKPGKKDKPEDYNGPRDTSGIVAFAKNLAETAAPPPPPREIVQLTGEDALQKACGEESGASLCILAFLPHILDSKAAGRQQYLSVLKEVATKHSRKPFGLLWSEAGAQLDLESQLQIGGSGYPALTILNVKKSKYSNMLGSLSSDSITEFLRRLLNGKEHSESFQMPKLEKVSAWDGQDAQAPIEQGDDEL